VSINQKLRYSGVGDLLYLNNSNLSEGGFRRIKSVYPAHDSSAILVDKPLEQLTGGTTSVRSSAGSFYIFNAGTLSATSFKRLDLFSGVETSLSVTGLPASWGTAGYLASNFDPRAIYLTGQASSGGTNALSFSNDAGGGSSINYATTSQYIGFVIQIYEGTGSGQRREITACNLGAGTIDLNVSPDWTTPPDSTSKFMILGNPDYLYLLGNNAVTVYRYSISGNSWTTTTNCSITPNVIGRLMSVSTPIGYNTGLGETQYPLNSAPFTAYNPTAFYLFSNSTVVYSFRTMGQLSPVWTPESTTIPENPVSGSSFCSDGNRFYVAQGNTGRIYICEPRMGSPKALPIKGYVEGAAVAGSKLFFKWADETRTKGWLYSLSNTSNVLKRIQVNYDDRW
jgi:hypothetical protein